MVAPAAAAAAAAAPAGSDDGDSGFGGFSTGNGTGNGDSQVKRNSRSATPADAPAGEEQSSAAATTTTPAATAVGALAAAAALAQAVAAAPESPASASNVARQGSDAGLSSLITPAGANAATANGPVGSGNGSGSGVRHVKISPAKPTTMTYDAADGNSSSSGNGQPIRDAKALLLQLFADFPTACLDMIETTDGAAILEGPVLTRAARQMPACMGRGGVVVLGEAAHPVRPSGESVGEEGTCVLALHPAVPLSVGQWPSAASDTEQGQHRPSFSCLTMYIWDRNLGISKDTVKRLQQLLGPQLQTRAEAGTRQVRHRANTMCALHCLLVYCCRSGGVSGIRGCS